jgi:Fic family protein
MSWSPDRPYNELPLLPPQAELETRAVLKRCITARAALAELKQAAQRIPNQAVLINAIPLLEAKDSSEIENIVTTTDRLFQFSQTESGADSATKEALRYRTALRDGCKAISTRPLSTNTAIDICRTIKDADIDIRKVPGTALANDRTGAVIYTPPEGEHHLRDLLGNWERFLHEQTELDPLVRLAVGHYQFEAIHPFTDGNGRTGRVVNLLFLIQQGLLDQPILYLSRFIISRKNDYYRLLLDVTSKEAWEDWLLFMLQGVEETACWTVKKIDAIAALETNTAKFVDAALPKIYSRELVELIFTQPYCRIANLVDQGIAKRQSASKYLKELTRIGVLKEQQHGRETLFIHTRFLNLLKDDGNTVEAYDMNKFFGF